MAFLGRRQPFAPKFRPPPYIYAVQPQTYLRMVSENMSLTDLCVVPVEELIGAEMFLFAKRGRTFELRDIS